MLTKAPNLRRLSMFMGNNLLYSNNFSVEKYEIPPEGKQILLSWKH